jgi:hypothetical protein
MPRPSSFGSKLRFSSYKCCPSVTAGSQLRGQFVHEDPVFWEIGQTQDGKAVLSNPQALNSYGYANGNLITGKDYYFFFARGSMNFGRPGVRPSNTPQNK